MAKQTQMTVDGGEVPVDQVNPKDRDIAAEAGEPLDGMPGAEMAVRGEATPIGREGDLGLGQYLATEQDEAMDEATLGYMSIVRQILSAETPQDVLVMEEATNARDMIGQPLIISGWHANRSEFDAGAPFYAYISCYDPDVGERVGVVTGNQAVLAQLVRLQQLHDAAEKMHAEWVRTGGTGDEPRPVFPIAAVFRQGRKPNRYGNYPLRLVAFEQAGAK